MHIYHCSGWLQHTQHHRRIGVCHNQRTPRDIGFHGFPLSGPEPEVYSRVARILIAVNPFQNLSDPLSMGEDGRSREAQWLAGGDWNMNFIFPLILGMSSSQLTFIFFRGIGIPPTRNAWKCKLSQDKPTILPSNSHCGTDSWPVFFFGPEMSRVLRPIYGAQYLQRYKCLGPAYQMLEAFGDSANEGPVPRKGSFQHLISTLQIHAPDILIIAPRNHIFEVLLRGLCTCIWDHRIYNGDV